MFINAAPARRNGAKGYEVRSFVKLKPANAGPRTVRREEFSTADRNLERWRESLTVGTGAKAAYTVEEGIKQKDLIFCHLTQGPQERDHKKTLTPNVAEIYLPRAFGMVLPQLVDLDKANAYAFAVYAAQPNAFDMRTFAVIGPEQITIAGRDVQAIKATDKAAEDAEPARLWVDKRGILLRMETAEGLVMESASQASLIRRFAADKAQIMKLK